MEKTNVMMLPGQTYHLYNRGTNSCEVFRKEIDFEKFMQKIPGILFPVAEFYAWALMKNHFHFLVQIKSGEEIEAFQASFRKKKLSAEVRIYQQFSNLFNAYAKYFNIKYERSGSLFEHPFKRREIEDEEDLRGVLNYIHNNPVHHNLVSHPIEYPWTSYISYLNTKTALFPEKLRCLFSDLQEFKSYNEKSCDRDFMDEDFF